jgi:phytoene/squalene synthetase
MKALFDQTSERISQVVTRKYSTSFSLAVNLLVPKIRKDIYNIYAFVRLADEIVDSFHGFEKERLLDKFEEDYYEAFEDGISLNPVLNAFQYTVKKNNIDDIQIQHFLKSMRRDLTQSNYESYADYQDYIYGSADVVGLMCLKVFVQGDQEKYDELKYYAEKLGSAFQKVNFLRDIKADMEQLDRSYFPNLNQSQFNHTTKQQIVEDIDNDFYIALQGIKKLPLEAKLGVYTAYLYYRKLLKKLKRTPYHEIMQARVRVSNPMKIGLLVRSFATIKLNLL